MSQTKYTPGPWVIKPPGSVIGHSSACVVKRETAFDWVATVQVSNTPEWRANAQLIVAAPELLDALQRWANAEQARAYIPDRERPAWDELMTATRDAITKATGATNA